MSELLDRNGFMQQRWVTSTAILIFSVTFVALSLITTTLSLQGAGLPLNENQILYLFSTSSQVISGIYGLTLTGFIFFRNELSREEFEDETLTDAIESLKKRYFLLLAFITALVVITIFLSNLAISTEITESTITKCIVLNTGQVAFIMSILAVTYFIFDVISPKRIENASLGLQNKLDPINSKWRKGSLEDFLRNFNQIESFLISAGTSYQKLGVTSSVYSEPRNVRRISNARLAEILFKSDKIDEELFLKLRELITLRNSIIHGAEPTVSQDLVQTTADVLTKLESTLKPSNNTGY